jgi:hypothetical protein
MSDVDDKCNNKVSTIEKPLIMQRYRMEYGVDYMIVFKS